MGEAKRKKELAGDDPLRGKNVSLCLMAYRDVEPDTVDCLIRDTLRLSTKCMVHYRRSSNDALVQRARSKIATQFLESSDELCIMIDHDMWWTGPTQTYEGDIERLLRTALKTRGIAGGVVAKRGFGKGIACRFPEDSKHDFTTGEDYVTPCLYVGSAFIAFHRDALEAILPQTINSRGEYHTFFGTLDVPCSDKPDMMEELSEDWAFCHRAKVAGVPINVDAKPVLGHIGLHTYTIPDAFDAVK